ncbi:MAG TPA: NBR1-Ig-like domain-containing protein [Anaerolineae bacterium]|nr:NBR1-Ig-like domain-containing protein [Anaerolineae bacterium]
MSIKQKRAEESVAVYQKKWGKPHMWLAAMGAVPLSVTPEMLYHIWATFQYDVTGEFLEIPWESVADFLLSSLCQPVGYEVYEVAPQVREVLLAWGVAEAGFGEQRLQEVAQFVRYYVARQVVTNDPLSQEEAERETLNVMSFVAPEALLDLIQDGYDEVVTEQDGQRLIHLKQMVSSSLPGVKVGAKGGAVADFEKLVKHMDGAEQLVRGRPVAKVAEEVRATFGQVMGGEVGQRPLPDIWQFREEERPRDPVEQVFGGGDEWRDPQPYDIETLLAGPKGDEEVIAEPLLTVTRWVRDAKRAWQEASYSSAEGPEEAAMLAVMSEERAGVAAAGRVLLEIHKEERVWPMLPQVRTRLAGEWLDAVYICGREYERSYEPRTFLRSVVAQLSRRYPEFGELVKEEMAGDEGMMQQREASGPFKGGGPSFVQREVRPSLGPEDLLAEVENWAVDDVYERILKRPWQRWLSGRNGELFPFVLIHGLDDEINGSGIFSLVRKMVLDLPGLGLVLTGMVTLGEMMQEYYMYGEEVMWPVSVVEGDMVTEVAGLLAGIGGDYEWLEICFRLGVDGERWQGEERWRELVVWARGNGWLAEVVTCGKGWDERVKWPEVVDREPRVLPLVWQHYYEQRWGWKEQIKQNFSLDEVRELYKEMGGEMAIESAILSATESLGEGVISLLGYSERRSLNMKLMMRLEEARPQVEWVGVARPALLSTFMAEMMETRLTEAELQALYTGFDVPGVKDQGDARPLVAAMWGRGERALLVAACEQRYPTVDWPAGDEWVELIETYFAGEEVVALAREVGMAGEVSGLVGRGRVETLVAKVREAEAMDTLRRVCAEWRTEVDWPLIKSKAGMLNDVRLRIRIVARRRVLMEIVDWEDNLRERLEGEFLYERYRSEIANWIEIRQRSQASFDRNGMQQLGELLYDSLFGGELRERFLRLYDEVRRSGQRLWVALDIDREGNDIVGWPWELLYVPSADIWLSMTDGILFSRRQSTVMLSKPIILSQNEPLRLMLVVANPADQRQIEYKPILASLNRLVDEKVIEIEMVLSASPKQIERILEKNKPHIVHFVGYGQMRNEKGEERAEIVLVDDLSGKSIWLDAERFGQLLHRYRPPVLLFQTGINSEKDDSGQAFVHIGAQLIQQNLIMAVVAISYPLTSKSISLFIMTLYERWARGDLVERGVQEGRRQMQMQDGAADFGAPVLFSRVGQGDLFVLESSKETTKSVVEEMGNWDGIFWSDVTLPDGSAVRAGERVEKVWVVRNDGDVAWDEGVRLVCIDEGEMEGVAVERVVGVPLLGVKEVGEVRVALSFPEGLAGQTVRSRWRFEREGTFFGDLLYVEVMVIGIQDGRGGESSYRSVE